MKQTYFVDVTETYTARIEVQANSPEDAEEVTDELVGGGKVDIVELALAGGPGTNYSKACTACEPRTGFHQMVDKNEVLKSIKFDESWIEVVK